MVRLSHISPRPRHRQPNERARAVTLGGYFPPHGAPRMIGARAGDAMRGLANQGLHARLIGAVNGTVIRQSPATGKPYNLVKGITLVAK
jgi:hypothetical protein